MIQVRAPNGTIIQFPDGTAPGQINSVMSSYHDAQQRAAAAEPVPGTLALHNGMTFGHAADIDAAKAALVTGARNLFGQGHGYGMSDAFNSTKAAEQGALASYAAKHPILDTAANVIGSVLNPASLVGGEYIGAAKGILPAMARAAAVGGAEGGLSGGVNGAVAGAALGAAAPAAGVAARGIGGAAGAVARNLQRSVGAADPARVAQRRLAAAIAKDVKAGVDPTANRSSWAGASQPTIADVAGENTRALVRDAGSQGPARQSLQTYRGQVAADLQGHALTLTRGLTPGDARAAPAVLADAVRRIETAATPPNVAAPGTGGAQLSAALNQRARAAKVGVDQAYADARAANPEQAHLPKEALAPLAASVREAVADFAPSATPNVRSVLGRLDTLNAPTARDLFEIRSQLGNLRVGVPSPETAAAGRAVSALDGQIDQALANGQFTGDPNVVSLWQNANAMRRAYGQQFEGNDLIHTLTSQEVHGAGRALSTAPEDASNAILGRSGVVPSPDLTRDLSRVGSILGDDHPALNALRQEATQRLLQPGAGTERFGTALDNFQRANPSLAPQILSPDVMSVADAQRRALAQAVADRGAVNVGQSIMSTAPDQFGIDFGSIAGREPLGRVGSRQALVDEIGGPTEGAIGALNRISTSTNTGQNLATAFGDDASNAYRQGLGAEVDRMTNANFMAPNTGAQTASKHQDLLAQILHGSHAIIDLAKNAIGGGPLTDAERAAIVAPTIAPVDDSYLAALLAARKAQGVLPGTGYAVAPLAITSGQAAANGP